MSTQLASGVNPRLVPSLERAIQTALPCLAMLALHHHHSLQDMEAIKIKPLRQYQERKR